MEEMKNRLLCTTIELESVKMEAGEEIKRYKHNMKHLLELLKIAYQERDDAREQLHRMLDKLASPNPRFNELHSSPAHPLGPQLDSYLITAKAISSLTESNNSHSPVDSFLDAVSSPDSSSLVFVNQQNSHVQEYGAGSLVGRKIDPCSGIIDDLAKGKALPQKGTLLQAVMEAGPLLQTLLVAGPLPQWQNPPPLLPIGVPPVVSIEGFDSASSSHQPVQSTTSGIIAQKPVSLGLYHDMPRVNAQMCSASMRSFMGSSGFPRNSIHPLFSGLSGQFPIAKRQRFQ